MTLYDLLIGASRQVGILEFHTTSSAGNTTSAKVESLRQDTADDQYNNGTFFIQTATGASTSISGQFRKITDYAASSGEFRWGTSVLSNVPAGALVAFTLDEFRTEMLIEFANDSLRSLGPLDFIDRATIQTSAAQTAYAGAVAWKYAPPRRIDVEGGAGTSTTDPDWYTITNWHYQPSTAGGTPLIIFDEQLPTGRDVRVWYQDHHHRVESSTSPIDERIHPDLALAAMVEKMYEYRNSRSRGGDGFDVQRWADAKLRLEQARVRWPMWKPQKKRKLAIIGREEEDHLPWPTPYGP